MTSVFIVGAGIFGSVIGHVLSQNGYEVTFIDSGEQNPGSAPAGCVMKPSWMTSFDTAPALRLLETYYDLHTIRFMILGALSANCFWVNPKQILHDDRVILREKVVSISNGAVETAEGNSYRGIIVVAAGVWSKSLLGDLCPDLQPLVGAAAFCDTTEKITPTIKPYAPYKQAVWLHHGKKTVWFGDGTSIQQKNFLNSHVDRTKGRCLEYTGLEPSRMVVGTRPYVKGSKVGVFERIGSRLFLSSGGAKNGTILAAHHAVTLAEHLKINV